MNKSFLKSSLETAAEADYVLISISFFLCILSSIILMIVYKRCSNSLSSKIQISPIIPLITNVTFLVILVVKSSLALSLGLVGALSVIRFRTPIKEPEDLAFLFLSIALGIGYGAQQIYITSFIFLIIILLILFFLKKTISNIKNDYNFIVEYNSESFKLDSNELIEILKSNSSNIEVNKIEKSDQKIICFYRVIFTSDININSLVEKINSKFVNIKFYFYENKFVD